jgi:hypothetical protein
VDPRTGRSRLIRWERYQHVRTTPAEMRRWFADHVSGSTLVYGTRMGLEFLDFDAPKVHARFVALVAARGLHSLLEHLPCEETPRVALTGPSSSHGAVGAR